MVSGIAPILRIHVYNVLLCLIYFQLIHPYSSAKADMAPPSKRRKITKTKQNGTETRQRPLTQRQTKSIYRRNLDIQNVHVVNNEDTDSNRNNEGSHTEQLQSIPTIDYTLLAREIIKQQGLMNSNNSSAGVQALNNSHNTAETQSTSFQSVENVDNNVHNTETVTLLPPLRSDLLIGERNSRIIPPIQPPSTCLPSDVSSVAHVNRGHVSMPGPQERQLNKDDNPLFNIVDQIFNAEPAVTATSGTELCHGPILDLSGGIPLGAHITHKVREKIWADEFIDLGTLLPDQETMDPWSVTISPHSMVMTSKQNKSKAPLSFYEWNEAFMIFMDIYLEKYPHEAKNMLKYMSIIKDLFEIKGVQAFRSYDQSFRLLKKNYKLPWQKPIDELYTKALNPKKQFKNVNTGSFNRPPFPINRDRDGTCHQYNNQGKCTRKICTFKHICRACRGPHPKIRCQKSVSQPQSSSTFPNKPIHIPSNTGKK